MTTSRLILVEVMADLTKKGGFRRKGLVWCRRSEQTLFSFEFLKSNYGDQYSMSLGVLFRRLTDGEDRPPHKCHFYGALGEDDSMRAALNFETSATEERVAILTRFRDNVLVPIAEECSTELGAVSYYQKGTLQIPLVLPVARSILGLDR